MIAQSSNQSLVAVDGFRLHVYASGGLETRATAIAARVGRAHAFLSRELAVEPEIELLVLAERDWSSRAAHPVYGMPNYARRTIVVAGEPSNFWASLLTLIESAPKARQREVERVYRRGDGAIDLSPFFDLLAVEELGHAFHHAAGVRLPRLWLAELFVNLCLHAYVASEEPRQLSILETFPRALTSIDAEAFPHRSLHDFELLYDTMSPENYGWYQTHLHMAAARAYESGGPAHAPAVMGVHPPYRRAATQHTRERGRCQARKRGARMASVGDRRRNHSGGALARPNTAGPSACTHRPSRRCANRC